MVLVAKHLACRYGHAQGLGVKGNLVCQASSCCRVTMSAVHPLLPFLATFASCPCLALVPSLAPRRGTAGPNSPLLCPLPCPGAVAPELCPLQR